MKTLTFLITAFLFMIFPSCSDDDRENNSDFFVINENLGEPINHKVFNPPLQISTSLNHSNYYSDSIDLDNNGVNDVCFESIFNKYRRWYSKSAQIRIVNNNFFIPFIWVNKIDYLCSYKLSDTTYQFFYQNNPGSCNNSSIINTIDLSQDHPRYMNLNDSIFFSNTINFGWSPCPQGDAYVLSASDSIMGSIENESQILGYQFTYSHQGIWDGEGAKYLVFKIEDDDSFKYGWIKLKITESTNIQIFEIVCL